MKVTIKTAFTPTINIDTKKSSSPFFNKFLKPYITIDDFPVYYPNGNPNSGGLTFIILAGIIALLVARGLYA